MLGGCGRVMLFAGSLLFACDSPSAPDAPVASTSVVVAAASTTAPNDVSGAIDRGCPPWSRPSPCADGTQKQTALRGPASVHGLDNRVDLYCKDGDADMATPIGAAIALLRVCDLSLNPTTHRYRLAERRLSGFCTDEAFVGQPIGVACSGVLVAPDTVLTSTSCFPEFQRNHLVFAFDVRIDPKDPTAPIELDPAAVCRPGAFRTLNGGRLALIEMTCPAPHGRTPARLAATAPQAGDAVYAIGHPWELPAKYSGLAEVRLGEAGLFRAYLDVMPGNSGSPVYNAAHEVVGVIIEADPATTCHDEVRGCQRWRACRDGDVGCFGATVVLAQDATAMLERK